MLQYDNESQFFILFRMAGSVIPQSILLGLLTFSLGLVLAILRKQNKTIEIFNDENYLLTDEFFKILCTVVGFLLVMRTNQALNRWMHAVTQVEVMLSKWADAYNALNSFFSGKEGSPDVLERILLFRIRVAHWFSLMSCLAFATLKNGHVNNLAEIGIRPKYPESHLALKKSFSRAQEFDDDVFQEQQKPEKDSGPAFQVLHAPTEDEVAVLEGSVDKVNIIALWIVQGIMLEVRAKTLDAPPPIVTRVFQEISVGMLGFHQAHKVAMVPFPFPFAQMVTMLLTLLYIAFPFFIDDFTHSVTITPIISFIIPVCYCSLNSLAVDLEVPFGASLNCVDIMVFNQAFLDLLEDTLLQPQVPPTSEFSRLEREIIQGIEFTKPREDPVPVEGAALVPAASFARTPDPLASAAVMPVASWNIPRATAPSKTADKRAPSPANRKAAGPRSAAQSSELAASAPPPSTAPAPEASGDSTPATKNSVSSSEKSALQTRQEAIARARVSNMSNGVPDTFKPEATSGSPARTSIGPVATQPEAEQSPERVSIQPDAIGAGQPEVGARSSARASAGPEATPAEGGARSSARNSTQPDAIGAGQVEAVPRSSARASAGPETNPAEGDARSSVRNSTQPDAIGAGQAEAVPRSSARASAGPEAAPAEGDGWSSVRNSTQPDAIGAGQAEAVPRSSARTSTGSDAAPAQEASARNSAGASAGPDATPEAGARSSTRSSAQPDTTVAGQAEAVPRSSARQSSRSGAAQAQEASARSSGKSSAEPEAATNRATTRGSARDSPSPPRKILPQTDIYDGAPPDFFSRVGR